MNKKTPKLCFVVGPIGAEDSDDRTHADWLLEYIILPEMAEYSEFETKRADQISTPGMIDAQIINALLSADLVIADLSRHNPNAFYEIGIRHMAQKPIIHMQTVDETIPFDVSLYRAIKYSRLRPRDIASARHALKLQLASVLSADYEIENPVTRTRGVVRLEHDATSTEKVLMNQMRSLEARVAAVEDQKPFKTNPVNALPSLISHQYTLEAVLDPEVNDEDKLSILNEIRATSPNARITGQATEPTIRVFFESTSSGAQRVADDISELPGVLAVSTPRRRAGI